MGHFLDMLFMDFQWYRKLVGGHWECWWVEGVCDMAWHRVDRCRAKAVNFDGPAGRPSMGCRGTPLCEEW